MTICANFYDYIRFSHFQDFSYFVYFMHTGEESSPENLLLHGPFSRKPKRIRTAFSPSQLLRLERAFEKNHYVVGAERKQLANGLCLTETQVRVSGTDTQIQTYRMHTYTHM